MDASAFLVLGSEDEEVAIDGLCGDGVPIRVACRTDAVKLHIACVRVGGARASIHNVVVFDADITVEIYLEVHLGVHSYCCVAA